MYESLLFNETENLQQIGVTPKKDEQGNFLLVCEEYDWKAGKNTPFQISIPHDALRTMADKSETPAEAIRDYYRQSVLMLLAMALIRCGGPSKVIPLIGHLCGMDGFSKDLDVLVASMHKKGDTLDLYKVLQTVAAQNAEEVLRISGNEHMIERVKGSFKGIHYS